jgi:hypothetical protein
MDVNKKPAKKAIEQTVFIRTPILMMLMYRMTQQLTKG